MECIDEWDKSYNHECQDRNCSTRSQSSKIQSPRKEEHGDNVVDDEHQDVGIVLNNEPGSPWTGRNLTRLKRSPLFGSWPWIARTNGQPQCKNEQERRGEEEDDVTSFLR